MFSYIFNQQINYPVLLKMSILNVGLSSILHHIDTNGSGSSMVVTIWFTTELSQSDQNTLNQIMSSYADPTTSPQMISSITTALQNNDNLLLILRTRTISVLSTCSYGELQGICTLLGITP